MATNDEYPEAIFGVYLFSDILLRPLLISGCFATSCWLREKKKGWLAGSQIHTFPTRVFGDINYRRRNVITNLI